MNLYLGSLGAFISHDFASSFNWNILGQYFFSNEIEVVHTRKRSLQWNMLRKFRKCISLMKILQLRISFPLNNYLDFHSKTHLWRLKASISQEASGFPSAGLLRPLTCQGHFFFAVGAVVKPSHRIHVWYIYKQFLVDFMGKVGKYTLHGSYGFGCSILGIIRPSDMGNI